jgi:hypothetical protein
VLDAAKAAQRFADAWAKNAINGAVTKTMRARHVHKIGGPSRPADRVPGPSLKDLSRRGAVALANAAVPNPP